MRREDGDIVSAGTAVPLFEAPGWVDLIVRRVLEPAFEDLARDPALSLPVNVSAATLRGSARRELLSSALARSPDGASPTCRATMSAPPSFPPGAPKGPHSARVND